MSVFNYPAKYTGFCTSSQYPIPGTVYQSPFDGLWYEAVNAFDQYRYPMVAWVYTPDPTLEPYVAQESDPPAKEDLPPLKVDIVAKVTEPAKVPPVTKEDAPFVVVAKKQKPIKAPASVVPPVKKEPAVVKTKLSNRQKHEIFTRDLCAEILRAISEKRFDKNRILVLNLFKVFGEEGRQLRRLAEEDEKNAMFWKQNKLSLPMADVRAVLPEWLTITCQPADEGHYWPRILLHMKGFRP
jgi:hypothetical protein